MTQEKSRRLGRGLEALLGGAAGAALPEAAAGTSESPLRDIAVASIRPNRYQPRKDFPVGDTAELEMSLAESGLLQPITVRPDGEGFELIAGERRLRAATKLGWTHIQAIVRQLDDKAALTLALVENLQRKDLNPLEEAEGYDRLSKEFGLTQLDIALLVGKDRSTIANSLRLLNLPDNIRNFIRKGTLTAGHGRALLQVSSAMVRDDMAKLAASGEMSVRAMEERIRLASLPPRKKGMSIYPQVGQPQVRDPMLERIVDQMRAYLQTDVRVDLRAPQGGDVVIRFYSDDDLNRLLERVLGPTEKREEAQ